MVFAEPCSVNANSGAPMGSIKYSALLEAVFSARSAVLGLCSAAVSWDRQPLQSSTSFGLLSRMAQYCVLCSLNAVFGVCSAVRRLGPVLNACSAVFGVFGVRRDVVVLCSACSVFVERSSKTFCVRRFCVRCSARPLSWKRFLTALKRESAM